MEDSRNNIETLRSLLSDIHQLLSAKSSISKANERQITLKSTQIVAILTTFEVEADDLHQVVRCITECLQHRNADVRLSAFSMLDSCLEFHLVKLTGKRQELFDLMMCNHPNDYVSCQKSMNKLTCDGRKITPFETQLGSLLLRWLTESGAQKEVDVFFVNVLKRSPHALDEASVSSMAQILCSRCDSAWKLCDSESCKQFLRIFTAIATNGYACALSSSECLQTLCCMVNEDGQGTWHIMKNLLNSAWGHQVLRGLLRILDAAHEHTQWVLRGAVFFVGMSCWGSQRVSRLNFNWGTILPSLLSAISCDHGVVVFEVILSIQRLIKKYGMQMRVEWDIVLEIFAQLRPWVATTIGDDDAADPERHFATVGSYEDETAEASIHVHHTRIPKELLDTIKLIEDLYHKGEFHGDSEHFFQLLDMYLGYLSESTILLLLEFRADGAHPAHNVNWLQRLETIVEVFFLSTTPMSATVRQHALDVLQLTLWSCKNVCEDRIIEEVVLPHLSYVYDDEEAGVRRKGLDLIIEITRQLETLKFDALLDVLENAVYHSVYVDSQLIAISGIVSLFSSVFNHLPYSRALRMYELIISIVGSHRDWSIRRVALTCLLHVSQANSTFQLQWVDNQVRTSQFLFCSNSSMKPDRIGAFVPVYRAIGVLLTLASTETRAELFHMVAKGIKMMLNNSYILTDTNVEDTATKLISCLQCQAFGRAALPDELRNFDSECNPAGEELQPNAFRRRRSESTETDQHIVGSVANQYATAVLQSQHMQTGYELLVLHLGNSAARLSPLVLKQALKCLQTALDIRPIVEDSSLVGGGGGSGSSHSALWVDANLGGQGDESKMTPSPLYVCPPPSPNFVVADDGPPSKARTAVSHGFTSRVLSKLNVKSASTKERDSVVRTSMSLKREEELIAAEYNFKRVVFRGVSLASMLVPHELSSMLTEILDSIRSSSFSSRGGWRRDIFGASLELVLDILLVESITVTVHNYIQIIRLALPGIHVDQSCKKTCVLAYKVVMQCFSRCPCPDRIHLAEIAIPQLNLYLMDLNNSVAEAASDFIMRLTYAPGDSLPHCYQPAVPSTIFFQRNPTNKSKSWIHGNALICITTGKLGYADITIRRASGTTQWLMQLRNHLWNGQLHPLVRHRSPFEASYYAERAHDGHFVCRRSMSTSSDSKSNTSSEPNLERRATCRLADVMGDDAKECPDMIESKTRKPHVAVAVARVHDVEDHPSAKFSLLSRGSSSFLLKTRRGSEGVVSRRSKLLPLPSYDGNGGSPSLFMDKATEQTDEVQLTVQDLLKELPFHSMRSLDHTAMHSSVSVPSTAAKLEIATDSIFPTSSVPPYDASAVVDATEPIDPAFLMMQLHDMNRGGQAPQLIQTGESYDRAINVLDRTPGIETHKIGVLYVGRNQSKEEEILRNHSGSPDYVDFLTKLGQIVKLSQLRGYSGGLDMADESDGEYGLTWRDDCVQAIFHVATLMTPKRSTTTSSTANVTVSKKRLIGNDYVHIVYSDSKEPYASDTITGHFNDVHIIIEPLYGAYFRVEVRTKPNIGAFGPLYGVQIIPSSILASMVRLTAFNANVACRIHHEEMVEFVTNAEDRLKQIKQIRNRHSV